MGHKCGLLPAVRYIITHPPLELGQRLFISQRSATIMFHIIRHLNNTYEFNVDGNVGNLSNAAALPLPTWSDCSALEYPNIPANLTKVWINGSFVEVYNPRNVNCEPNYLVAYDALNYLMMLVSLHFFLKFGTYFVQRLIAMRSEQKVIMMTMPWQVNIYGMLSMLCAAVEVVNLQERRYDDFGISKACEFIQYHFGMMIM